MPKCKQCKGSDYGNGHSQRLNFAWFWKSTSIPYTLSLGVLYLC